MPLLHSFLAAGVPGPFQEQLSGLHYSPLCDPVKAFPPQVSPSSRPGPL